MASSSESEIETIYLRLYKNFMEAIDAIDNGINQWEGDSAPKYLINTHLSARVGSLNPSWNEDSSGKYLCLLVFVLVCSLNIHST